MRIEKKTAFRPFLESVEARIVATGGVVAAAHAHTPSHVASHQPETVSAESHHKAPAPKHHAAASPKDHSTRTNSVTVTINRSSSTTQNITIINTTNSTTTSSSASAPLAPSPNNSTTNQAWVELVNTTGQDLEYQIKLGPYDHGQFIPFDIPSGGVQYQMSSLISNGQRVKADFAIQFGNGPITPLTTGISQDSAQGYYIMLGSNFEYYVTPFLQS